MALLPSFTFIIGGSILAAIGGRRARLIRLSSAGLAVAILALLYRQLPATVELAIWRPVSLFGQGFVFSIDASAWPLLLLSCGILIADTLLGDNEAISLFYAGAALTAIAAGNLPTVAMIWTLMIVLEAVLRAQAGRSEAEILKMFGVQAAAVVILTAAGYAGNYFAILVSVAVLLRAGGGLSAENSLGFAIFAPLAAFSFMVRADMGPTSFVWIWIPIALAILIHSIIFEARQVGFVLALTAASMTSPSEGQGVIWIAAAGSLTLVLGVLRVAGSRYAWTAVALYPLAFVSGGASGFEVWILAILFTATVAAVARLLPESGDIGSLGRLEIVALASMLLATAAAILAFGIFPGGESFPIMGLGLSAGYGIALLHPRLLGYQPFVLKRISSAQEFLLALLRAMGSGIRITVSVLEGESAVLWILLALLVAVIGLQVIAA